MNAPVSLSFEAGDYETFGPYHQLRENLMALEPEDDKKLLRVFAVSLDGGRHEIGHIELTSKFIASAFDDEKLLVKHTGTKRRNSDIEAAVDAGAACPFRPER